MKKLSLNNFTFIDNYGMSYLDVASLDELSDKDFIEMQENDMQSHFNFLNKCNIFEVKCGQCNSLITNPNDLVRYFGENIHKICFKFYYPKDREKWMKLNKQEAIFYFDKVYSLVVLGKRERLF